jgi:DNA-binding beta-propeller fold protein YncE
MSRIVVAALLAIPLVAAPVPDLVALIQTLPKLPLMRTDVRIQAPSAGWELGMISTLSVSPDGTIYLLQRGPHADPVVAVNREGKVLRSWGAGLFDIPHGVRIGPDGNIWTVDSSSSVVQEFTPQGVKLLEIPVGGQPSAQKGRAVGTTDIAFGAGGRIFISDGYANARILEYDTNGKTDGKKVAEWGTRGEGPGQLHLPHAIIADEDLLYVADRENGRVQIFDPAGKYRGEWDNLGKPMSLHTGVQGTIWVGTNLTSGALTGGWVLELDKQTGKPLGYIEAGEADVHAMTVTAEGDVLVAGKGVIEWFHAGK